MSVWPRAQLVVADGYAYAGYLGEASSHAWVLRMGGIAGATEWFDPSSIDFPEISDLVRTANQMGALIAGEWKSC